MRHRHTAVLAMNDIGELCLIFTWSFGSCAFSLVLLYLPVVWRVSLTRLKTQTIKKSVIRNASIFLRNKLSILLSTFLNHLSPTLHPPPLTLHPPSNHPPTTHLIDTHQSLGTCPPTPFAALVADSSSFLSDTSVSVCGVSVVVVVGCWKVVVGRDYDCVGCKLSMLVVAIMLWWL